MNTCIRCHGTGFQEFEEDGRWFRDACYHCANTGEVDDETAFHDRLMNVARTLAYDHVCEMKKNVNSNPDGEGWDFCAAENMMSGSDYFEMHVYDYTQQYTEQLSNLSRSSQELLVAWHDMPRETIRVQVDAGPSYTAPIFNMEVWGGDDDNLPF